MGKVGMTAFAAIGLAACMGAMWACGGSAADVIKPPVDGGGNVAAAEADAGDKPYTLDDVCERTGPIICELRKPCCESGPGFDETACLANAKKTCEADVAAVRAGQATFHGERIPGCIPRYREILKSCALTFELVQKYSRDLAQCDAFEGSLPEGAACERGSQCKPGATSNELAGCDEGTKRCRLTKLLAEGATCTIGTDLPDICAEGLYCNVSFASQPFTGVCKKKTSVGVACDKDQEPFALECGLGNYCDRTTGLCTVGKRGNAACANDLECASVSCTKPATGSGSGTCKPLGTLVKPAECKGS
jgi:hypothetical protein